MPLQLDGDDLPGLGKGRYDLSHSLDRHVGTVKQDQRLAGAVDLLVSIEAVHLGVVAFMNRRSFRLLSGRQVLPTWPWSWSPRTHLLATPSGR